MDRMVYVAMTGAKQLMQAQALVANNLANVSTTGFRADLARFDAEQVQGPGYPSRINTVAAGVGFDHTQGTLVQTGSVLDVAIDGDGWLAVQAKDGSQAYSRGGSLKVNALGPARDRARRDRARRQRPAGRSAVHADRARGGRHDFGRAAGPGARDARAGRTTEAREPARAAARETADGLVRVKGGAPAASDANVRVVSGAIETSNVNTAATLVDMIEYARQFDLAVRMMQTADQNATRAASLASLN